MRFTIRQLIGLLTLISVGLAMIVFVYAAIQTRLVAKIDHPNGTRLRLVQEFTYSGELFETSIYFDDGDGKWRWYYYDHDDGYWGSAIIRVDGPQISITHKKRSVLFDTVTGECSIAQADGARRKDNKSVRIDNLSPEIKKVLEDSSPSGSAR